MPLNQDPPKTVEPYIDADGNVYLYEKNRWGSERMLESLPQRLFTLKDSSYITDGDWWDVPQPLSNSSMHAITEGIGPDLEETHYLVETRGPGVQIGSGSYIPSEYRVVTIVPTEILRKMKIVNYGVKRFVGDKIEAFEKEFWTPARMKTAWKYAKAYLPADLPQWEVIEAEEVFMSGRRPLWMASVSLAAARGHYFENRRQYNTYVLGRDETPEEREQRLNCARDSRAMAAFYRAFAGPDGRTVLLKKTKKVGATRLVNQHDRAFKEVYDDVAQQFERLQHEIDEWFTTNGRSN